MYNKCSSSNSSSTCFLFSFLKICVWIPAAPHVSLNWPRPQLRNSIRNVASARAITRTPHLNQGVPMIFLSLLLSVPIEECAIDKRLFFLVLLKSSMLSTARGQQSSRGKRKKKKK